jgi:hypothetical protein
MPIVADLTDSFAVVTTRDEGESLFQMPNPRRHIRWHRRRAKTCRLVRPGCHAGSHWLALLAILSVMTDRLSSLFPFRAPI